MKGGVAMVVEAAYAVAPDAREWLVNVVREAARALGRGVVGNLVERQNDGTLRSAHVALEGVAERWVKTLARTAERMRSDDLERRFTTSVVAERGVLLVSARADGRRALLLDASLDEELPFPSPEFFSTWTDAANHLACGLRRLGASPLPSPDDAEGAWRALLDGRLALVDRFDREGRRFVVVRPASPHEREALTLRERQVLASVALGHANKRIAFDLGVSESTVSSALRAAARKLGVRSRVELARILGPPRRSLPLPPSQNRPSEP